MRGAFALAVLLLAGCSSPASEAEPETPVSVVTDPRDLEASRQPGSHIHDYWGGRDTVTVLDRQGGEMRASCSGCDAREGMAIQFARPEEGVIVPQGTAWLNGTVTVEHAADGENQYPRLELWVKTAADIEPTRALEVASGVPFSLASTREANDPPHYVLSLWRFEVRVVGAAELAFAGSVHLRADAVRGLPLEPYPPHPDRWGGASELPLAADSRSSMLVYTTQVPGYGGSMSCYGSCPGTHIPLDGAVVPHDATSVQVRLTLQEGLPVGLGLAFHGADTWDFAVAAGTMESPGVYVFDIPIGDAMADSPYAPQSLWEFDVFLDAPTPVQAWSGTYTLEATSVK